MTVEMEQRMEMEDRVQDQQDAVMLMDPEVGGAVFSRAECQVLATALAVAEVARDVVGGEWSDEQVTSVERLRMKACAGAAR